MMAFNYDSANTSLDKSGLLFDYVPSMQMGGMDPEAMQNSVRHQLVNSVLDAPLYQFAKQTKKSKIKVTNMLA